MEYLFTSTIKSTVMKKFLFMTFILGAILATTTNAQSAADPGAVLQQMKEQQKPGLMQKVGLTEAQAEKIIEINYETRMQAGRELEGLNEADRTKKLAEIKAAKEKKYSEILTPEQVKALKTYYEEMAKNREKKPGN
jgi:Spy/CpxP family protein refolding chaperone